ncbi:GNAT family N-acetyltransferase [Anaerolineales bacterium HSG6]|nr:GNAT family N-acetyltransferase [Anaerolineales bacterium HSG6]MDM8530396.1 GNAT family N-acetyltransferase [Anaerolineales bacterium HSG25]
MAIEIVTELPINKWRVYVENHPHGGIFHTPEMFELFQCIDNHIPTLWAAVTDNTVQALMLPVEITLKNILRPFTTRAVVYSSALYDDSPMGHESLSILLDTYNKKVHPNIIFTEFRNQIDMSLVQPILEQHGFLYEHHLNFLIDINRPLTEIMQDIGKRTRKQIRSGLSKKLVTLEQASTVEQVQECYSLIKRSYTSAQVHLAEFSFFKNIFDHFYPKGLAMFWLARFEGVCVASSIELPYKDVLYGWYSGVDRDYSKYYPGELLMWHVLEWGAENGYKVYDFGGAGKPDEEYGVRKFKAKFGGKMVDYGRNASIHRPMTLQVSKLGYELYRRLL